MLILILALLILLYLLGYIQIPAFNIPDFPLFIINNHQITLWEFLLFFVIIWAISALPSPFRQIAGVILVLWLLSTLGFIAITGLANILVIALIAGVVISLVD